MIYAWPLVYDIEYIIGYNLLAFVCINCYFAWFMFFGGLFACYEQMSRNARFRSSLYNKVSLNICFCIIFLFLVSYIIKGFIDMLEDEFGRRMLLIGLLEIIIFIVTAIYASIVKKRAMRRRAHIELIEEPFE